jgi:hypothetical protein
MSIVAYTGIKVRQMIYVIFFLLNLFFEREREREKESLHLPTGLSAWKFLPCVHITNFLAAGMEGLSEFEGY